MTDKILTQRVFKRWPIQLLAAMSLSVFAVALVFHNKFNVLPAKRLALAGFLLVPAFGVLAFLANRLFSPERKLLVKPRLLFLALAASALLIWLVPAPVLDFPQNHHLILQATGEKAPRATNSLVEIRELRYLNGQSIPPEYISMTPDWQTEGDVFFSKGGPGSRLEIQGQAPAGILVRLRYWEEGGQVSITWDEKQQNVDLFSASGTVLPHSFYGAGLAKMSAGHALITLIFWLLYLLGVFAAVICALLALVYFFPNRWEQNAFALALILFAVVFLYFKVIYLKIDSPRVFRDSMAYVVVAQESALSPAFYTNTRAFTLPLFLKILGTTLENYNTTNQLMRIDYAQVVLSVLSWGVLAFTLMRTTKQRWLQFTLFGGTLAFSLSLEVSLWDALLLSESVSFSLFALLMACWVWVLVVLPGVQQPWVRLTGMGLTFLVSLLYTFVRDSNIYLILMVTVVLALGALLDRRLVQVRRLIWSLVGLMFALFLAQNLSLNSGNRWQIFMYDHLAVRFLNDPEATEFFVKEGLPMSDLLMRTTQMSGVEYQKTFIEAPEMQPVRDWVNQTSKRAYILYLLSDPLGSLKEPLDNADKLINGSNLEYRSPAYGVQPVPDQLAQINDLFFQHQPWMPYLLTLAALVGIVYYIKQRSSLMWILIAGLVLSLYPLMFLIWHAEPLEIERHAANLQLQFRLAGWLSLAYWAEEITRLVGKNINLRVE